VIFYIAQRAIEHQSRKPLTRKLYETTIFERDVLEYASLGGVEYVSNLIAAGLTHQSHGPVTMGLVVEKDALQLTFLRNDPYMPRPITIILRVPAVRRSSAAEDTEVMSRRLRDMEAKMAGLLDQITSLRERALWTAVPGGGPPCPIDATSVTVGYTMDHAAAIQSNKCGKTYRHLSNQSDWNQSDISNLRHLTECTTLHIAGCAAALDFSCLKALTKLKVLSITMAVNDGAATIPSYGCNPVLKDISWIADLKELRTVNFFGCSKLVDITPLKDLPQLTHLTLTQTAVINTDWLTVSKPKCTIVR
jgi:hypothetical protein